MFDKLGVGGIVGVLVMLAGVAVVAWEAPIVAAGIAITIAGLGLIVYSLITNFLSSMGMGAML